jgi:hypothetical protein
MKTLILGTILSAVIATTGAVSASANPFTGLPTWAQEALGPKN